MSKYSAVFKKNKNVINSIKDLKNLHFANRQDGSGTKIYLDYLLKKNKIDSYKNVISKLNLRK